jgi:hypothetical protein
MWRNFEELWRNLGDAIFLQQAGTVIRTQSLTAEIKE